ncbi:glycosyltransferase, partial [Lactobacillus gallinarum]|uniref:glycosyltransferase n=1 Tax=Lactobacillus gallinarum TaxID=52242 RepID=UPI0025A3B4D0
MNKKVQVLLSAYNGEKYIVKQIESILNQENVDVHILIRDDGSTDNTVNLINNVKKKYPLAVDLIKGNNLGYKKSFLELCHRTNIDYDYYAFSDQDDYWLPNKLEKAVHYLSLNNNRIKLYASTVNVTDENLKVLYKKDISNFVNTFGSSLTRVRLAGCTYVFNLASLKLLRDYNYENIPDKQMMSHDGLLISLCQALDGFVYIDQSSYILHRRRAQSITSGGNGIKKRIQIEKDMIFNHKNDRFLLA